MRTCARRGRFKDAGRTILLAWLDSPVLCYQLFFSCKYYLYSSVFIFFLMKFRPHGRLHPRFVPVAHSLRVVALNTSCFSN
jgi:hypothetical protein